VGTDFNVFISWSGDRSRSVATALHAWLPKVIQAAKPWMSEIDIEKGTRSLGEISKALAGAKFGICCLTPENLQAPWLLYETGALSKMIDDRTRLWTYLYSGLRPGDVTGPLSQFQHTRADREDTRKLLHSINRALGATPIPESNLDELLEAMWPRLEEQLRGIPETQQQTVTRRSADEMVAEILEWTRAETRRREEREAALTAMQGQVWELRAPYLPTLPPLPEPLWRVKAAPSAGAEEREDKR
jgi:hypothetical protein